MYEIRAVLFFIFCVMIGPSLEQETIPDDLVSGLYLKYIEALGNDINTASLRRSIKHNREYRVHVKKLKEVNGFKTHNLLITKEVKGEPDNPIIYINNPVETKISNAYLTLEEFKKVLTDRVSRQRNPLNAENKHYTNNNNAKTTRVVNTTKNYTTVYVTNKIFIYQKITGSVNIKHEKTTNITSKKENGDFKNTKNLILNTTFSIKTQQTKSSKASIFTTKHRSKLTSISKNSVTELRTIADRKGEKPTTIFKAAIISNNVTGTRIPESSAINTIKTRNTKASDQNFHTHIENTTHPTNIIGNITYLEEGTPIESTIKNAAEEIVTEKEVPTTTVRKLTRSKLSRPLVFMDD